MSLAQATKDLVRRVGVLGARCVLQAGSKPFQLTDTVTVVIAPHQDDETFGCGGIIARKRSEGLTVHVVFITDGSASHPGHARLSPAEISALRRREAMKALGLLGVETCAVHFLDEPDGTLKEVRGERRGRLVEVLGGLLESLGPGEVFLPCHPDGSSEHDATFGFVQDALARRHLRPVVWQYPVWAWWNPVLLLRCWAANGGCRSLPIEDYYPLKQRAAAAYQSQIAPLAPETAAVLPAALLNTFLARTEYFFRSANPPATDEHTR